MKLKLVYLACLLANIANAQITLEHTYPNASNFLPSANQQQLIVVHLEVDGEKFVHIDRLNKILDFYNLDHTSWKSISFSAAIDLNPNRNYMDILYISQHLFDTDNEVEFMYIDQYYNTVVTQIVNEDASIIFTANDEMGVVRLNAPQTQFPIYNTAAGTKMVLSNTNNDVSVYSLPGVLSVCTAISAEENTADYLLFPNPSSSSFRLKTSNVDFDRIRISDQYGKVVKELSFSAVSGNEVNVSDLSVGVYFVQLINKRGQLIETQKLIKY